MPPALLILFGLGGALLGGIVFKGKSGWCSSICPMLPVQRIYGQTPFKAVGNCPLPALSGLHQELL